jgi:hypothetical protein
MGDYVLESNPALERLIERLAAPSRPPAHDQTSRLDDSTRNRRRRRSKASKRIREDPMTVGEKKPVESARVAEPEDLDDELVTEDDLWAIHEDPQAADEMVLVGFDEEPEVFAEEFVDDGDDTFECDEADEILDVYGRLDTDEYGESAYEDAEVFGETGVVLEEDQDVDIDDEVSVQASSAAENEEGDWIIDAFKAWMLKAAEAPG